MNPFSKIISLLLFKFVFLSYFGAGHAFGEKVSGIIIKENGDTMRVTLDIPVGGRNFYRMQEKVKYYDAEGKKQKLKPDEIREVTFIYDNNPVRLISKPYKNMGVIQLKLSNQKNVLLELLIDGKVQVYRFGYYQPSGSNGGYMTEEYLLQKKGEEFYQPRALRFKKDMVEYLSPCTAITGKIENNEYKQENLLELIKDYNKNCND